MVSTGMMLGLSTSFPWHTDDAKFVEGLLLFACQDPFKHSCILNIQNKISLSTVVLNSRD